MLNENVISTKFLNQATYRLFTSLLVSELFIISLPGLQSPSSSISISSSKRRSLLQSLSVNAKLSKPIWKMWLCYISCLCFTYAISGIAAHARVVARHLRISSFGVGTERITPGIARVWVASQTSDLNVVVSEVTCRSVVRVVVWKSVAILPRSWKDATRVV